MHTMPKDLLLVGSIPLSSAEEVFRTCAATVGDLVNCLPDGEYDERIWWVNQQAWRVFHPHPDIATLKRPRPIDGKENWKPQGVDDYWKFKLDDGVTDLRFDDLTYADAAIASYDAFCRLLLRRPGRVPDHQRRLRGRHAARDRADGRAHPTERPRRPVGLLRRDPRRRGPLPVDAVRAEVRAQRRAVRTRHSLDPGGGPRRLPLLLRHARGVADAAARRPRLCVRMANEAVRRAGRRVDYVHMPAPRKAGDAFFAPLRDLDIGDTKVFLGIIHHTEGTDPTLFEQRARAARRYLPRFGVSGVCGYGRVEDPMHDVLVGHRANTEALHEAVGA